MSDPTVTRQREQRAQRDQEVEVEAAHIHGVHDNHNCGSIADKPPPASYSSALRQILSHW